MQIYRKRNRYALSALLFALGGTSVLSATTANADSVLNLKPDMNAGDFNLTTQVGNEMDFPVMFDRPSGVNGAGVWGAS